MHGKKIVLGLLGTASGKFKMIYNDLQMIYIISK